MTKLPIPLSSETKAFYERLHTWKHNFPFLATTATEFPRAELLKSGPRELYGRYHRILTPDSQLAVWCFDSEEHRNQFCQRYSATAVELA